MQSMVPTIVPPRQLGADVYADTPQQLIDGRRQDFSTKLALAAQLSPVKEVFVELAGVSSLFYAFEPYSTCELAVFGQAYYEGELNSYQNGFDSRPTLIPLPALVRMRLIQTMRGPHTNEVGFNQLRLLTYLHAGLPSAATDMSRTNPLAYEIHQEIALMPEPKSSDLNYRSLTSDAADIEMLDRFKGVRQKTANDNATGVDIQTSTVASDTIATVGKVVEWLQQRANTIIEDGVTIKSDYTGMTPTMTENNAWFQVYLKLCMDAASLMATWTRRFNTEGGLTGYITKPTLDMLLARLETIEDYLYDCLAIIEALDLLYELLSMIGTDRVHWSNTIILCGHRAARLIGSAMQRQTVTTVHAAYTALEDSGSRGKHADAALLWMTPAHAMLLYSSIFGSSSFGASFRHKMSNLERRLLLEMQWPDYCIDMWQQMSGTGTVRPALYQLLRYRPLISLFLNERQLMDGSSPYYIRVVGTVLLIYCPQSYMLFVKENVSDQANAGMLQFWSTTVPSSIADRMVQVYRKLGTSVM